MAGIMRRLDCRGVAGANEDVVAALGAAARRDSYDPDNPDKHRIDPPTGA